MQREGIERGIPESGCGRLWEQALTISANAVGEGLWIKSIGRDLVGLTAEIISAYVSNNTVAAEDLAGIIADVHDALSGPRSASAAPSARS